MAVLSTLSKILQILTLEIFIMKCQSYRNLSNKMARYLMLKLVSVKTPNLGQYFTQVFPND